jgi:hypothetical protein
MDRVGRACWLLCELGECLVTELETASLSAGAGRLGLVGRAVRVWTGELVDLGGPNTLLYYRDLKQGTLDIGPGSGASPVAVDALLSSRQVRLSMLFRDVVVGGAARRTRTVKAKATENFEERGLQTLFLAWGMATWSNVRGTAVPAAPLLLRQAALTARGGAGEDFDAGLPGEWEIIVDGGYPHLPTDLAGSEGAFGQLHAEMQALAGSTGAGAWTS